MKADSRLGTQLGGYRIEELIGRGGMSAVYLAEDLRLGRKVALKLIAPDLAEDERFRERFVRESRLAASLEHPNIVPIYEAGEADGVLFIAMRHIGGTDLRALIKSEGPLDPPRTLGLLGQVADALDAAHAKGLVHRDVKPANILIASRPSRGAAEHSYLSDFGLTKRASSDSGITATGQFVGTIDYAAPEQFEGKPLDARTDIYSLACVLFECLTGEVPYRRDQDAALMYAHLMAPVPSATERNPGLPSAIDGVMATGMAKPAEDRFATVGDLVESAREAFAIHAPTVRTAPPMERPSEKLPSLSRGPRIVAAAVAATLLAVIILVMTRDGGRTTGSTSPSPTGVVVAPDKGSLLALDATGGRPLGTAVPLGKGTGSVAVGFGSVWVTNQDEDTVMRIDALSRQRIATIAVGDRPRGIAVGQGDPDVWVVTDDGLWSIDPVTNIVNRTITLNERPIAVAVGSGSVWVLYDYVRFSTEPGLLRVDPKARTVAEKIQVNEFSAPASGIAAGEGAIWAIDPQVLVANPGHLIRVDPSTNRVRKAPINSPVAVAVGEAAVWVLDTSGAVFRIAPVTMRVVDRIGASSGATAIAVGEGAVWVLNRVRENLTRIDVSSGRAAEPVDLDGKPASLAVGDGIVWIRLEGI
jgi:YVTN family beta-propeller protein